jgi:hypothetical protein
LTTNVDAATVVVMNTARATQTVETDNGAIAALDEFERAVDNAERGTEAERVESRADIVLCADEFEALAVQPDALPTVERMRAASLIQRARAMGERRDALGSALAGVDVSDERIAVPPDVDRQTVEMVAVLLHIVNGTGSISAKEYADALARCIAVGWIEMSGTLHGAHVALTPAGIRFLHTIGVTT